MNTLPGMPNTIYESSSRSPCTSKVLLRDGIAKSIGGRESSGSSPGTLLKPEKDQRGTDKPSSIISFHFTCIEANFSRLIYMIKKMQMVSILSEVP
ncbi:hypothetical protein TIFTF001_010265 [Ficus carica]|uniref:Uncharacterized protein n=1 Tax=Ficus carica TaxID=3494 RepID=A0AA87ZV80_FICCA|nr:hypothetical protein TIFTF001_010265 [Ficus carica]